MKRLNNDRWGGVARGGLLLVLAMWTATGCGERRKPEPPGAAVAPVAAAGASAMALEGLSVAARESAPGLFEIRVVPAGAALEPFGGADGAGSGEVILEPATGSIELRAEGKTLWSGRIEAIERFGRAAVPGLSVRWRARPGETLHGLGERFDAFDLHGRRVEMWIRDEPGQGDGGASYFATPVLYSGAGYALFAADNPEGVFDLDSAGEGWHRYDRAGRELRLWIAAGADLRDLARRRAEAIGGLRGVPDWVWGPWISRNSYENQAEAEEAVEGMVARGIPVGVVVQEAWKGNWDTGDYNSFSADRWPELDRFLDRCAELGIRNVLWQVPVLHPTAPYYPEAAERGFLVKAPDGSVRLREHWMVGFGNVDFTNPDAVKFWQDLQRPLLGKKTVAGFKADDGEDVQPDDVFHDGRRGWQLHNEYSALYAKALTALMDEEGVEGFLWSRSGSLGIERTPGLWAGDQFATWEQMASLIPAGLSAGLSGAPFWGHDVGGYVGNPGAELYVRWAQFGAFSPLMQYHGVEPREPWFFGERTAEIYGRLARLRMNLRPYLAALGREAAETGVPIMRPMAMEFPGDARFAREQTQYMLGPDLLVAPVLEPRPGRRVAFPEGVWQHLIHPVSFQGPAAVEVSIPDGSVPVFVRQGAELPVELDEGAALGEWREGAPARRISFGPERVALPRLAAPFRADVAEGRAEVAARVGANVAERMFVETWWGEEGVPVARAFEIRQGVPTADLSPTNRAPRPGEVQRYRIFLRGEGRRSPHRLLYEGELRWESPVALEAAQEGSAYVGEGRRILRTALANSADRAVSVRISAAASPNVLVQPRGRSVRLEPRSRATLEWTADFADDGEIGGRGVRFDVHAGEAWLDAAELRFPRPWRWIVAGPFPQPPRAGHRVPLQPEWTVRPDVVFDTGAGTARWWALDLAHAERNDGIDFLEAFGPGEHAVAYALAKIDSDREREVEAWMGSDDTLALWHNGVRVHDAEAYRGAARDQDRVGLRLVEGVNVLMAKVAQESGEWRLHFRLADPGDQPAAGLRDGFDDHGDYDPERPLAKKIVAPPPLGTWKIAGPFPAGHFEREMREAGAAAWAALDWVEAMAPARDDEGIDLAARLGAGENAEAFAWLEFDLDAPALVEFRCGSDDGMTLWLDGRELLDVPALRPFAPGKNVVRAELPAGRRRVLCRIRQGDGAWTFRTEIWDVSAWPPRPIVR